MLIAGIPWWATDLDLVIGCGPDAIPGGGTKIPQAARHQPAGEKANCLDSIHFPLFCQGNSSAPIDGGASLEQDKSHPGPPLGDSLTRVLGENPWRVALACGAHRARLEERKMQPSGRGSWGH